MSGFYITQVKLFGTGVRDAIVDFEKGLNVITGPSDTGKTFIVQCINYMFGSSSPPKEIPEIRGYEAIGMTIIAPDGTPFELSRGLGNSVTQLVVKGETSRLRSKHDPQRTDTLSSLLLGLSGLYGLVVRKNKRGETRQLSFRDIARLILINEEEIITERSPILSGMPINATVEACVFRLLLSGTDDSSVVASEDPRIDKLMMESHAEAIDYIITVTMDKISNLTLGMAPREVQGRFAQINAALDHISGELDTEQGTIVVLEEQRDGLVRQYREVESRLSFVSELHMRFLLLNDQYMSDLKRLEAIAEASIRIEQLPIERCPVCGAPAEYHDHGHRDYSSLPENVSAACDAEVGKIHSLLAGLQGTIDTNDQERMGLEEQKVGVRAKIEEISSVIQKRLQPHIQVLIQRFREYQEQRDVYRHAMDLYSQIQELREMTATGISTTTDTPSESIPKGISSTDSEGFSRAVEAVLKSWNYPKLDRVVFSDSAMDIVVSGRDRSSHGKGVRAVTHAAFNIALMKYCVDRELPHPGTLIIDSPLVVYREPDSEGVPAELKNTFFKALAETFQEQQVIIVENEEPPPELEETAKVIRFTGTTIGRKGFIPV